MKFLVPISICILVGCGVIDDPEPPVNAEQGADGKADDASASGAVGAAGQDSQGGSEPDPGEEAEFDLCGEFDLYGDGECHDFCFEPDPDCDGEPAPEPEPVDPCEEAGGGSDGYCQESCESVDPDCVVEDGDWEEDQYTLDICEGLNVSSEHIENFAETLCYEWEEMPTAYEQCIAACLAAYYGR